MAENKIINTKERVKMYSTKLHPGYKKDGKEFEVHPLQVDKLLKHKWATKTKAKE